ncbi:MAG: hypothetical protein NC900_03015 [Candidatus Omnitrophica bacterium]|nr:hypothetical protein [Candidatus Omnitrophota bacterium]
MNRIIIFYDENLQKFTGIPFEEVKIPNNFTFLDFLHSLFSSYPEIPKNIPPGKLGFLLNGKTPESFDILRDQDQIELIVINEIRKLSQEEIKDIQKEIEFEISYFINRYKIDILFEKIKEVIFNEEGFQDFCFMIDDFCRRIDVPEESMRAKHILMKAWLYFPHRSLGGLSPIEKRFES